MRPVKAGVKILLPTGNSGNEENFYMEKEQYVSGWYFFLFRGAGSWYH